MAAEPAKVPTPRTHALCWVCKAVLRPSIAHCESHTCPWCASCVKRAEDRAAGV